MYKEVVHCTPFLCSLWHQLSSGGRFAFSHDIWSLKMYYLLINFLCAFLQCNYCRELDFVNWTMHWFPLWISCLCYRFLLSKNWLKWPFLDWGVRTCQEQLSIQRVAIIIPSDRQMLLIKPALLPLPPPFSCCILLYLFSFTYTFIVISIMRYTILRDFFFLEKMKLIYIISVFLCRRPMWVTFQ